MHLLGIAYLGIPLIVTCILSPNENMLFTKNSCGLPLYSFYSCAKVYSYFKVLNFFYPHFLPEAELSINAQSTISGYISCYIF